MSDEQRTEDWESSREKMSRADDDFLFENQDMTWHTEIPATEVYCANGSVYLK